MITYFFAAVLMFIGVVSILTRANLLKKIIGLTIFTNGVHMLFITIGYKAGGVVAIRTSVDPAFLVLAVDPIPQALVLTSIVIDLSVSALAVAMCILLHEKTGTINSEKIKELKG
jgi:multicomponent Na+:H+ antiporter subunit C